ncbi:hypothetical protein GA0115251_106436 [Streptomyces sp. TverLS-915]|uniref:DUF6891 domain-containing protein n=1 Tax=Streptomyces sp. TverLS-915 TaxID=1839763 RepID=UPI00081F4240|nr:hypothetical protein [Streptomyces sp. TverLS-915]SCD38379.1 hypothetical protein GA0115251_106436 [Streptomyces sp. TverLS-915]
MLAIVIRTEPGESHERVSAEGLAGLVRRVGGRKDRFLVLERLPDEPDFYAQVWHEDEGSYQVEYRDGSARRHFQAHTDDADAVAAALTGWARRTPGWDAALTWSLLDLGEPDGPGDSAPDDAAPVPDSGAPAPDQEPPAPGLSAGDLAELEGVVRVALHGGYRDPEALAELAEEYFVADDRRPVTAAQARALVDRLWRERLAEQEAWHGETDPERLTRAFTALDAAGVVAREDFTCCRSCGMGEIGAEAGPGGARGFVFFHEQCTDGAVTGGGLRLYYGGFDDEERTTAAIGREVVAALAAAGLRTTWDGSPARAIEVTPLDWRRRLPVG